MSSANDMLEAARGVLVRAYAPYSGYAVGAALRAESGRVYAGCNVENAAYPHGICAEASALAALVAGGDGRVTEVLVMADGVALCTPCGGCRQRLVEFADTSVAVHLCNRDGIRKTVALGELLPMAFSAENLS